MNQHKCCHTGKGVDEDHRGEVALLGGGIRFLLLGFHKGLVRDEHGKQNQRNDGIQVEQIGDLPAELSAHKAGNIGEHKAPESAACQHKTDDIGKLLALKEVGQDGSGDQDEDAGTKADDEAAEQDQIDAGAARDDEQTTHEEAGDGEIGHLLFVHSAAQCKADEVSRDLGEVAHRDDEIAEHLVRPALRFDHGGKQRSVQLHIGAVEKRKDEHDNGDHLACLGQVFILYGHADVLPAYASL